VRPVIAGVLFFVSILAIGAGVLYLVEPAHSLPTFFPGYLAHASGKHPRHGYIAIAAGVVLDIIGIVLLVTGSRSSRTV
jgi:hypothetical protein